MDLILFHVFIQENNCASADIIEESDHTTTINLPNHDVTIVETEAFNPFSNMFMGSNNSDEQEKTNKTDIKWVAETLFARDGYASDW